MRSFLGLFFLCFCVIPAFASVPDGSSLYEKHCVVCHGDSGRGGVGVPLGLPSFLGSVDDDYLRKTIRLGRPGRVMPAFTTLSDEELEAIVSNIRAFADVPVPSFSPKTITGDVNKGSDLFKQHCAVCHGANGEGGHGTGVTFSRPRDLPITAPSLNNSGFLASASDSMIKRTLMDGREGTPMLSFIKLGLSEQDIDDLVSYIRSFTEKLSSTTMDEAPVLIAESSYSLEETLENLRQALVGKNFKLIREQYLEENLLPKDQQNSKQIVVYFCNFKFLNDAMTVDPRIGLFLPCRITLIEAEGKVKLMTINPLLLSKLFNNKELDKFCEEMYNNYQELLEDVTL